MKNGTKSRWHSVRGVFCLVVLPVGAVLTPYVLSVAEPVKVILLGTVLVGVAVWGKKHVKRQANS
jgi:hypothetical protein